MGYKEILNDQLQDILRKQEEIIINDNLAKVCRELDRFTVKIKDCLAKDQDLSQQDKDRIQELNNDYNSNIDRFRKIKGL